MRCLESWCLFVRNGLWRSSIPSLINRGTKCSSDESWAFVSRRKCSLFWGLKSHTFDALEKPIKAYFNQVSSKTSMALTSASQDSNFQHARIKKDKIAVTTLSGLRWATATPHWIRHQHKDRKENDRKSKNEWGKGAWVGREKSE